MLVNIPYGSKSLSFNLEDSKLLQILTPKDFKPKRSYEEEIIDSLKRPIGSSNLSSVIGSKRKVGIACDDITRLTPNESILKVLLKELRGLGVKKEDITLFIALGTHRKMRDDEIIKKFGKDIAEEYHIENHEYNNPEMLEKVGEIDNLAIWVNKYFLRKEVKMSIGGIIPHCNAGWGAGGKTILPGLAGFESVGKFHCYSALTVPNALGLIDIPVREVIDSFAKKIGLSFILNVIYNRKAETLKAFSGDVIKAHREGIKESKKVYGIELKGKADITIVSSYPADLEFWQAHKGLASGDIANREGGGIILVTPCYEGISVAHKNWGELLNHEPEELKDMILNNRVEDYVAAGLALAIAIERSKHKVCIVSEGLSYKDAEKLKFEKFQTIEEALDYLKRIYGEESKINLLTHGGETYPIAQV